MFLKGILTHLAYIANGHFWHFADVSLRFHDVYCPYIFTSTTYEMHVKVSITVKNVGGISIFDGGKLNESEGYNYFFVVYVLESK